jgi:hypothetical protein
MKTIFILIFAIAFVYSFFNPIEGLSIALIAGIVDPQVLGAVIADKLANMFMNAADIDTRNEFSVGTPGTSWEIPLNDLIPAFQRDGNGVTLVPQSLTQDKYKMVVQRAGKSYREDSIDKMVTGDKKKSTLNLAQRIAERIKDYMIQSRFWVLEGAIPAANRRPALGATLTANEVGAGKRLIGDKSQNLKYAVMHSKTFEDLQIGGWITWQSMVSVIDTGNGYATRFNLGDVPPANRVATIRGLICIVTDYCTTVAGTPTQYVTYLLAPGAMGLFFQKEVEMSEDKETLVDGGYKFFTPRINFVMCLHGMDYTQATSPQLYTQAALQATANYTMVFANAKNVQAVRLLHQ